MGFHQGNVVTSFNSPFAAASALARRLTAIGINPFQSEAQRYVVLLENGGGEILDWGRPLRGTRFFGPIAIRKDRPMVSAFESFAKQHGLHECVFWGVGLTGAKADPDHLDAELKRFNRTINIEFSELRKSGAFEMLLLVIHPRYDKVSGLFDLHAHFIAKVPLEQREAVKHRLRVKFSKFDLPDHPIRKAAAVATYMLWGIFRNKVMVQWPDHALKAAWKLTESRFRFVRTGGRFAKWKASKTALTEKAVATMDQAQKSINRAVTADPRQKVVNGDRLLSKIMLKIRGVRVPALLYEAASDGQMSDAEQAERRYSSANNITTQDSANAAQTAVSSVWSRGANLIWNGLKTRLSRITEPVLSCGRKIFEIGKKLMEGFLR